QKGMYEEAIAELQKERNLFGGPSRHLAQLGYAYAVSGKRDQAQGVLDEVEEASKLYRPTPITYDRALIYAGLGEKDQAFAWLEKAYQVRHGAMALYKVEPMLDSLRSDPRYA